MLPSSCEKDDYMNGKVKIENLQSEVITITGMKDLAKRIRPGSYVYIGLANDGPHLLTQDHSRVVAYAEDMLQTLKTLVKENYGQPSGVTIPALDAARILISRVELTT